MSNAPSHSNHGNAHDHAHDPTAKPGGVPAPAPGAQDPGAQALSEALQSSFKIVKFLMVALLVAFFASGFFTVKPNEVAIKLRFGRPVGVGPKQLLAPGAHWSLPYPIEEIVYVPVGESRTITSTAGWYYLTDEEAVSGEPQALPSLRPGVDGYTLTGDGNIIHVKATLSYRISDPISYAFNFTDTTNLLQHVLDNALFYASARFTADDALYGRNKLAFQETILTHVTRSIDALKLGVTIEPREVDTRPPLFVRAAFDEVTKAQQQGDIKIQEAETYARGITNRAFGEASVIVQDGVTRSNYLLQTIAADADRFQKLLPLYEADPGLYRQRLLAETWGRVLTNAQYKFYLPRRADGKPRELRLQLSKEPEVPVRETAKP